MTHPTCTLISVPAHVFGLDIGDKVCVYRERLGDGRRGRRGEVQTERASLEAFFSGLEPCRIVMETCTQSQWISRLARACGHEVIVANSRKLKALSTDNKKSDEADADFLAREGRVDVSRLHPVTHGSEQAQTDRELLQSRALLVRQRVSLVNHVRSVVKVHGYQVKATVHSFTKKAWPQIPEQLRSALRGIFITIGVISRQIDELDKQIEAVGKARYPVTRMFTDNVPGVAMLTATAYALRIEDPTRFKQSRQVGAYLGLVQRKHQSGKSDPHLGITKAGDKELRRLLVQSANQILGRGKDCDLRRFGERIANKGGKHARKRAKVAIARKLAVLMHLMWKRGEVYDPHYQKKLAGEPVPS